MSTRKPGRGATNVDPPEVAAPSAPKARPAAKRSTSKPAPSAPTGAEDLIEKAFSLHSMAKAMGRTAPIDGFFKQVESILGPEKAAAAFRARGMEPPAAPAPAADAPPTNIPAGDTGPVTSADESLPTPPRQQAAKPRAQSQADAARDARMARAAELEKRDPEGFGALKKQGWSAEAIGDMDDARFAETVSKHLGDRTPAPAAASATPQPQATNATPQPAQQAPAAGGTGAPPPPPGGASPPPPPPPPPPGGGSGSNNSNNPFAGVNWSQYQNGSTGPYNPFAGVNWSQYQGNNVPGVSPTASPQTQSLIRRLLLGAKGAGGQWQSGLVSPRWSSDPAAQAAGWSNNPVVNVSNTLTSPRLMTAATFAGTGALAAKGLYALGGAKNIGGGVGGLVQEAWSGEPAEPAPETPKKTRYAVDDIEAARRLLSTPISTIRAERNAQPAP